MKLSGHTPAQFICQVHPERTISKFNTNMAIGSEKTENQIISQKLLVILVKLGPHLTCFLHVLHSPQQGDALVGCQKDLGIFARITESRSGIMEEKTI